MYTWSKVTAQYQTAHRYSVDFIIGASFVASLQSDPCKQSKFNEWTIS